MSALIILASGLSERFGEPDKLLADLNGQPVASYPIAAAAPIEFSTRLAVVPSQNSALQTFFNNAGYNTIRNPNPEAGLAYSRAMGLDVLKALHMGSACILLADMPAITTAHIRKLMLAQGNVIMSRYQGVFMPPVFLRGLDSVLVPDTHIELTAHQARDIDTQEDLAAMARAMSG